MRASEINPSRAVAGVVFAAIGIAFLLENLGVWTIDPVFAWPLMLIGTGISVVVGRARRRRIDENRSAKLAVAEERVRIARELHDIVAHGVSLMTIQIAAARRIAARQPDAAEEALAAAEQAGRQSLAELRSLLGVLRSADFSLGEARTVRDPDGDLLETAAPERPPDEVAPTAPLPRLAEIGDLVENLRNASIDVSFEQEGPMPRTSPAVELSVYRVVQEALTNAVRHAPGASVRVHLWYGPDSIRAVIEDDGRTALQTRPVEGHGLIGMRERVAAVGGTVSAGPRPEGGWRVDAWVPTVPA